MKRLLTALLTLCLLTALAPRLAAQPSEIIDKVISIVGAEYILLSELEEQYALAASEQADLPEDARCIFLDQLLTTRLLLNQSKLDSIEVGDDEVERQLEARISRILAYMNDDRQQFEDYYGQSVVQVKERFREDLRNQLLVERMRGQVVNSVTVTPSEVKRFFAEIPQDSLPYFNSEVEIGEIVYVPKANEGEMERTRTKLEEIRAEIVAGTLPFEEAAKKFSMDGSGQAGGDLGWAGRGRYVPEFEATAYNLEPGEMSEVIQTEFGFHVLRLDGRRGSSIRVSHILLMPTVSDDDIQRGKAYLDSIAHLIRVDSIGFSRAVKRFGDKEQQSYTNDGRMVSQATGNTFFEVGDLDPGIYFTIDTMKVGGISGALEYTGPRRETLLRIVQLQSRTKPHRAGLSQDYAKIQTATKQSKQNVHLSDWIEGRLNATYIWIDPRYEGCPSLEKWSEDKANSSANVIRVGGR